MFSRRYLSLALLSALTCAAVFNVGPACGPAKIHRIQDVRRYLRGTGEVFMHDDGASFSIVLPAASASDDTLLLLRSVGNIKKLVFRHPAAARSEVSRVGIASLKEHGRLVEIDCTLLNLSSDAIEELGCLENVKSLCVGSTSNPDCVWKFGNLPHLEELCIDRMCLSSRTVQHLLRAPAISRLSLSNCMLQHDGGGVIAIGDSSIKHLVLINVAAGFNCRLPIGDIPHLQSITLSDMPGGSTEIFAGAKAVLVREIEMLSMSPSSADLHFAASVTNLRLLNLSGSKLPESAAAILSGMHGLDTLIIPANGLQVESLAELKNQLSSTKIVIDSSE